MHNKVNFYIMDNIKLYQENFTKRISFLNNFEIESYCKNSKIQWKSKFHRDLFLIFESLRVNKTRLRKKNARKILGCNNNNTIRL